MPLRIVVVEDEPAIRRHLEDAVAALPDCVLLGSCGTLAETRVLLHTTKPDLLLLDIELSDGVAFDLLQDEESFQFKIIFITAFNQYALNAIKAGAIDYLLKPFSSQDLAAAIQKAGKVLPFERQMLEISHNQYLGRTPQKLVLRSVGSLQIVETGQIMYCQSYEGYTTFYLNDGQKPVASHAIKTYEDILPPSTFIRCHQSYLVNVNYISSFLHEGIIILKNRQQIPVSQRKKERLLAVINSL